MARINQAIGRGIRFKSHSSLPPNKRVVSVFFWQSKPKLKKGKMGADEYLYKICDKKAKIMDEFRKVLIKTSIETNVCRVNPKNRHKVLEKMF